MSNLLRIVFIFAALSILIGDNSPLTFKGKQIIYTQNEQEEDNEQTKKEKENEEKEEEKEKKDDRDKQYQYTQSFNIGSTKLSCHTCFIALFFENISYDLESPPPEA